MSSRSSMQICHVKKYIKNICNLDEFTRPSESDIKNIVMSCKPKCKTLCRHVILISIKQIVKSNTASELRQTGSVVISL